MYEEKDHTNLDKEAVNELPEIPAAPVEPVYYGPPVPPRSVSAPVLIETDHAPAPKRQSGWRGLVAAVALVAMGAVVGSATTMALTDYFRTDPMPIGYVLPAYDGRGLTAVSDVPFEGSNPIPTIYRRVVPAVVKIAVQTSRGAGSGSGFVVDPGGYILTNHHVVNNANRVEVGFVDGTKLMATIVGSDPYADLAVLKVDTGNRTLVAIPLGDSDTLVVGELAIAIGSPFGNDYTVTSGIISGLNRSILEENSPYPIPGAIQTDAAINPGNSGGPLLNARGEVIGINTAIESPTRGSVGIGFAVPVNAAKKILPTLIAGQRVEYPYLGVSVMDLHPTLAAQLGVSSQSGAMIREVISGSPAAAAGLMSVGLNRRGEPVSADVIIEMNGTAIRSGDDLVRFVREQKVGDQVSITVLRGSERVVINATLTARQ